MCKRGLVRYFSPHDVVLEQAEAADLRKQMEELRTQLQRNEEMVRWLNNQVRGQQTG